MKTLYWRSNTVSTPQLAIVALLSLVGLWWLESNPVEEQTQLYEPKLEATRLANEAFRAIYVERIRLAIPLDPEIDPAGSGLIGSPQSPIVSNKGHLPSKQTSANPNFAAVLVEMLDKAGVDRGEVVAANLTGSFPAINTALYAAFEVLDIDCIVVSSVGASDYGATHPKLTWLDMERVLYEQDLLSFRSVIATMGGAMDVAKKHSPEGREAIEKAIRRNGRPMRKPEDYKQAVSLRMALFDEMSEDRPVAAFVNVGGGTASVGTAEDKHDFRPGFNEELPQDLENPSVMRAFLERDVPVLHLSHIRTLARRYGLPDTPETMPAPGEGGVFRRASIPPLAILSVVLGIIAALFAATRYDVATMFARRSDRGDSSRPKV